MKNRSYVPSSLVLLIACFFLLLSQSSCGGDESEPTPIEEVVDAVPEVTTGPGMGDARDISSFDLVDEMGPGWNLGNSFDVRSRDKTFWGNPLPSKAVIDAVREMGFTTLRIPVTWGFHQELGPNYTVEAAYLESVREVVEYGFQNQMHVIINVHHDDGWVVPNAASAEVSKLRLGRLWTQVATYFQYYNDSLIFEVLNEPRLIDTPEEWTGGTPEGRGLINDFNKAAVDAIRATGGNNAKRHLMIPTWAASTVPDAMDDLVVPNNDPKIIISQHSYFPWAFAGEASINWGTEADKAALEAELDKIQDKWITQANRPVILGEWGTISSNDLQERIDYASFYASQAKARGMLTIVWDDGGSFQLLNRRTLAWNFEDIASTIVSASE